MQNRLDENALFIVIVDVRYCNQAYDMITFIVLNQAIMKVSFVEHELSVLFLMSPINNNLI